MTVSQSEVLMAPHGAAPTVPLGVDQAAMRLIPEDNEALQLLKRYLQVLSKDLALMTPELRHLAATHIQDLMAIALAGARNRVVIANGHGVRATRLKAIKADILESLGDADLTVSAAALRQKVSPRYIHMLFETEGITFSGYVLGERLMRAQRMLSHPGFSGMSVSAIAFECGFGDLSYFNRTFRRRFGATPSEHRHGSQPLEVASPS